MTTSKATVLAHRSVAGELGTLEPWLLDRDFAIERVWREDGTPSPDADLLIVLGSPESVAVDHEAPWAWEELAMVRRWLDSGRPYLGVCFGAQMLARALDGSVERMARMQRGFVDVTWADGSVRGPWGISHEDAIIDAGRGEIVGTLPHAIAVLRAGNAWGVQPHIEFTAPIVERLSEALGVPRDRYTPMIDALAADEQAHASRSWALLDEMFAWLR